MDDFIYECPIVSQPYLVPHKASAPLKIDKHQQDQYKNWVWYSAPGVIVFRYLPSDSFGQIMTKMEQEYPDEFIYDKQILLNAIEVFKHVYENKEKYPEFEHILKVRE